MVLVDKLRDAVFQNALQGNLSVQSEDDSSAKELIEEIISKKEKLLQDKEIVKDNSCKTTKYCSKEIDLLEIPASWVWVKLGEICIKIGAGSTPNGGTKVYVKQGIKFIREQNVKNTGIDYTGIVYIDEKTNNSMKGSQVKPCDLLMNITGASIGRSSVVPEDFDAANVNQHVLVIRLVDKRLRNYIHTCFQSPLVFNQMMEQQKGDKPGLSATRVANFYLPIPPIEEQQRIVDRVDELIQQIDEYAKIEQQLISLKDSFPDDLRSAVLQAAMQGKLTERSVDDMDVDDLIRHARNERKLLIDNKDIKNEKLTEISDEDYPYEIPDSWRFIRLGEVIRLQSGQDMTPDMYSDVISEGVPYLTGASNIDNGRVIINRWTKSPKAIAEKGDLLLTCKGTVGLLAFLHEEKVHIARQIMSIKPLASVNLGYIKYCIESFILILKAKAKSEIPGIDRKAVLNLLIPLPSIEEQGRIVERLGVLLPVCEGIMEE